VYWKVCKFDIPKIPPKAKESKSHGTRTRKKNRKKWPSESYFAPSCSTLKRPKHKKTNTSKIILYDILRCVFPMIWYHMVPSAAWGKTYISLIMRLTWCSILQHSPHWADILHNDAKLNWKPASSTAMDCSRILDALQKNNKHHSDLVKLTVLTLGSLQCMRIC
jgi:hypothetical protein